MNMETTMMGGNPIRSIMVRRPWAVYTRIFRSD